MQFFKRFFKKTNIDKVKMSMPDNSKLFELLNEYIKDNKYDNYKKVVEELTGGNAYLLLASNKDFGNNYKNWTPVREGKK